MNFEYVMSMTKFLVKVLLTSRHLRMTEFYFNVIYKIVDEVFNMSSI